MDAHLTDFQAYLGFIAAAALLLLLPGPTNALLMTAGAAQPVRRALPLISAELIAYALAITPLLSFNEILGAWRETGGLALKMAALAIILLLACRMWLRAGQNTAGDRPLVTMSSVFWMTLVNPKSLVFAFVIFPPVDSPSDAAVKALLFVVLASLAGTAWIATGAIVSGGSQRLRAEWIGKAAALILFAFAIYLGASVVADAAAILR